MGEIGRRLSRLEERIGAEVCVCSERGREVACVAIEPGSTAEQIEMAEAAAQFDCPTHGRQTPVVLRLYGSDVYG